jgi:hypothetical protein
MDGLQIGYMDCRFVSLHTGCHQLVFGLQKNVVKSDSPTGSVKR